MNASIPIEQLDAIVEYLMSRPASETIMAILWLSEAKAKAEAETTDSEDK